MTSIPSLTLTEFRVVSIEHLQWMWHASREREPFRTPGSVPFLRLEYVPIVETSFPELVVSLPLNTPRYLPNFAYYNAFV